MKKTIALLLTALCLFAACSKGVGESTLPGTNKNPKRVEEKARAEGETEAPAQSVEPSVEAVPSPSASVAMGEPLTLGYLALQVPASWTIREQSDTSVTFETGGIRQSMLQYFVYDSLGDTPTEEQTKLFMELFLSSYEEIEGVENYELLETVEFDGCYGKIYENTFVGDDGGTGNYVRTYSLFARNHMYTFMVMDVYPTQDLLDTFNAVVGSVAVTYP